MDSNADNAVAQRELFDDFDDLDDFHALPWLNEAGTQLLAPPVTIVPISFLPRAGTPPAAPFNAVAAFAQITPTSELTTAQKVDRALAAIDHVMEREHATAWAFSSGKDSTVTMSLGIEAARRRLAAGKPVPQMLVTHADTGIENPAMHAVAMLEIARIERYCNSIDLPIQVDIAHPSMNDSWAVRIISGRALPTFANSSKRDCSLDWKIKPQLRQRKRVLGELGLGGANPVTITGTRYEESTDRARRMPERGETDTEIWVDQKFDASGSTIQTGLRLSPIAHWTQEDVWVYLAELNSGQRQSYTDAKDVWEIYADGGNSSCAVVGDDALQASKKACGARFGCALCTAVGRDKSLEAMLEADPKYAYLVPLNRLQRFLVDTQYDTDRRGWLGRTINAGGYIQVAPDSYSPAMQRELLRYAPSIDETERRASRRAGVAPRFQLVSNAQLIAIDLMWSMQGYHTRPFEAICIWDDVVVKGNLELPPEVDAKAYPRKFPAPRYLWVGNDWDDDPSFDVHYSGGRSLMADFTGASESCVENTTLSDGRVVLDVRRTPFFEVDEEAAQLFLDFDVFDNRIHEKCAKYDPRYAFEHYQILGVFSTSRQHMGDQDAILRRSAWKERHGVYDMTGDQLLARTVSRAEMEAGLLAPEGQATLREDLAAQSARDREAIRARN